jgi:hypothetical protein
MRRWLPGHLRRQTVIARRLQLARERHGRNALPYWVPSRMGPRRSRDPWPCRNHALGTEHAFRLPESLFSVTVAARFGQLFLEFAAGLAPARTGARPFFWAYR